MPSRRTSRHKSNTSKDNSSEESMDDLLYCECDKRDLELWKKELERYREWCENQPGWSEPLPLIHSPRETMAPTRTLKASYIGKSSSSSEESSDSEASGQSLDQYTPSPPDPLLLWNTFGKTRLLSQGLDSNSASDQSTAVNLRIGTLYANKHALEHYRQYRQTYSLDVTTNSEESNLIIADLLGLSKKYAVIGVLPQVVKVTVPGPKQGPTLTLKILGPNFGMATAVKQMLLLTNTVDQLTSRTCSAGWTNIRFALKLKEALQYLTRVTSGSLLTCTPEIGTPSLTPTQPQRSSDE